MTPASRGSTTRRRCCVGALLLAGVLGAAGSAAALAQGSTPPARSASKAPAAEQGVRWNDLKPAQQSTLKPLEREWGAISASHKQKWLELSTRFPTMTAAEQARIQERMADWVRMTSQQRSQARLNFQEAKQLPAQDRQARWNAYQALPLEERQQLAARALRAASAPTGDTARKIGPPGVRTDKPAREVPQAKSNIVPNPAFAAPPTAIAPVIVQARPGATTTSITKRPTPPSHQQAGLPKIAATPEFVNKNTLLPQRGPQGAAARSAAAPPSAEAASRQ